AIVPVCQWVEPDIRVGHIQTTERSPFRRAVARKDAGVVQYQASGNLLCRLLQQALQEVDFAAAAPPGNRNVGTVRSGPDDWRTGPGAAKRQVQISHRPASSPSISGSPRRSKAFLGSLYTCLDPLVPYWFQTLTRVSPVVALTGLPRSTPACRKARTTTGQLC